MLFPSASSDYLPALNGSPLFHSGPRYPIFCQAIVTKLFFIFGKQICLKKKRYFNVVLFYISHMNKVEHLFLYISEPFVFPCELLNYNFVHFSSGLVVIFLLLCRNIFRNVPFVYNEPEGAFYTLRKLALCL